jgi:tRNA(Leu) C34 or U34 (ribose-2'-O)-methylase TrmL
MRRILPAAVRLCKVPGMRGFFSIGAERISKPGNLGSLVRTAHAFGASSFFAIDPGPDLREMRFVDTSDAGVHLPLYLHDRPEDLVLPKDCVLVGIELTDDAIDLPSFRHPLRAAYVLGPERGSLSPAMQERCEFVIKIPMKFCVNVGVAGAIVMYDRMICLGRFAERPVRIGGPTEVLAEHVHGKQKIRNRLRRRRVNTCLAPDGVGNGGATG